MGESSGRPRRLYHTPVCKETASRLRKQRPGLGSSRFWCTVASDKAPDLSEHLPQSVRDGTNPDHARGTSRTRCERVPGCVVFVQTRKDAESPVPSGPCLGDGVFSSRNRVRARPSVMEKSPSATLTAPLPRHRGARGSPSCRALSCVDPVHGGGHTHAHEYTFVCTHIRTRVDTHVQTRVDTHTFTPSVHTHTYTHSRGCTHARTHLDTHVHTQRGHSHAHTQRAHSHIHTQCGCTHVHAPTWTHTCTHTPGHTRTHPAWTLTCTHTRVDAHTYTPSVDTHMHTPSVPTHTYIPSVDAHTCTHPPGHTCTHPEWTLTRTHTRVDEHMHAPTWTHTCTHPPGHTRTHPAWMHTRTHTHVDAHMHAPT